MFCQKCGAQMDDDALFCPKCGQAKNESVKPTQQKDLMQKNLSAKQGCGIFIAIILFACLSVSMCGDDKKSETKTVEKIAMPLTAEEQLAKRKEACFSAWDGSHLRIKDWLKRNYLNDPGSYEHVETRFGLIGTGDSLNVITKFTAKNGFGGRVAGYIQYKTIIPDINDTSVNLSNANWCPIFDFKTE